MRGAERRQTRELAIAPGRLAKPPETLARRLLIPCDRDEAPPGAPLAAILGTMRRSSGRQREVPSLGPARSGGLRSVVAVSCSPKSQGRPVFVPADGWPRPPGRGVRATPRA